MIAFRYKRASTSLTHITFIPCRTNVVDGSGRGRRNQSHVPDL